MSRRLLFAVLPLLLLTMAAAQQTPPQPTSLAVGSAILDHIKGEVVLHAADGSALSSQTGQVLLPGSMVETAKGTALLHLQDGSQVLVKAHSRVVLKAPAASKGHFFDLLLGKVFATIQKRLGSTPSFRMGTPSAVITVRGTRFEVEVTHKGMTRVTVYEGVVEVIGLTGMGGPVMLQPRFFTEIQPQHAPEAPRSLDPRETNERDNGRTGWPIPGTHGPGQYGGHDQGGAAGSSSGSSTGQSEQEPTDN
jgi:hypothetical protein